MSDTDPPAQQGAGPAPGPRRSDALSVRLQEVTEQLAAARSQAEVFEVVLQPAMQALGAVAATVLLVQDHDLKVRAQRGNDPGGRSIWQDAPRSADTPANDVLGGCGPLFFEEAGALSARYPGLEQQTGGRAAVASAVLPMFLDQEPLGTLMLDFQAPHDLTPEERHFLGTLAAQRAIALGRAGASTELERRVQERTAALDAFVAFTEAVGSETDALALIRQATWVVRASLGHVSVAYYELDQELWKARVWSEDLTPEIVAEIQAGVPQDAPNYAQATRSGAAVFVDGWEAEQEHLPSAGAYGAVALIPLPTQGKPPGLFTVGTRNARAWMERERATVRAVAHSLTLALERFAGLARTQESDAPTLIRQVQQAVTDLIGEGFAVYYELEDHVWVPKSQVGGTENATLQASLSSALPYELTRNLRTPWERGAAFYQDVYDPALDHGVPGSEAIASTATLPLFVGTRQQRIFAYGLNVYRSWSRADKATLETAVNSLGLALERAEPLWALEEERAAQAAFMRFTEASTRVMDVPALARQAGDVLRATLGSVSVGYYELEEGLWKARVLSEDVPALTAEAARAGFPADLPSFARPFQERGVVFVDGWDAEREGAESTEMYGAGALYPYFRQDSPSGLFTIGSSYARAWTERERSIFLAVSHSLELAFVRAEQNTRLAEQNAELEARTRALEAFAELTRDLTLNADPYALIRRAQEVLMSLLSEGVAVYYEPEGPLWRLRSQVGDMRNPALQAVLDAGLPYEAAQNLLLPWTTRHPYYQDEYDKSTDQLQAEQIEHIQATAALPLLVRGEPRGVFCVAIFQVHRWTGTDKAVLETVVRSLGLAIEGAQGVAQLAQRTRELERSNQELEQFAYVASHDLQEPLRSVASFSQLLVDRFPDQTDEKAQRYVRYVAEGTERMAQLIQDLLAFSRVATQTEPFKPASTRLVLAQVMQDQRAQIEGTGTTVVLGELPAVLGDATQLRQLFQNLIGNAIKFGDPARKPEVRVGSVREGGLVRFHVGDNGVGIRPEFFERIFVIFQRLHSRDRYQGNGMGLAIAKKIVERHGGSISLESTPGQGTTFSFTLPAAPPEAS